MENKFDSDEELWLSWYLEELQEAGYIKSYIHHPESYILASPQKYSFFKSVALKTKTVKSTLSILREHKYTPDFRVEWEHKAKGVFFDVFSSQTDLRRIPFIANADRCRYGHWPDFFSVIECKPTFSMYNMQREFALNQKWLYQKKGIFVQKVIVENKKKKTGLFPETFVPEIYKFTKKTKILKKLNYCVRTLHEYVDEKVGDQ